MQFPSKEVVAHLREMYPKGTRVELISMDDPYTRLKPGDKGRVDFVDDTGTLHTAWDSGPYLGVVYGIDHVRNIVDQKETAQTQPNTRLSKQKSGSKPNRGR
jgi:hypothetical protein